jgi:hypothetical protein
LEARQHQRQGWQGVGVSYGSRAWTSPRHCCWPSNASCDSLRPQLVFWSNLDFMAAPLLATSEVAAMSAFSSTPSTPMYGNEEQRRRSGRGTTVALFSTGRGFVWIVQLHSYDGPKADHDGLRSEDIGTSYSSVPGSVERSERKKAQNNCSRVNHRGNARHWMPVVA